MYKRTQNRSLTISSASPLISYYMSEMIPNYEEFISFNIKQLKFTEPVKEEANIGTQIESTIKKHHNFIIPAISLELNSNLPSSDEPRIELQLENLKELFGMFGEIKFIDITPYSSKAYILYKYYFSALFAFDTINQILSRKRTNDQITIKLVSEKAKQENPQQNDKTPMKLGLNTDCKAYIPKAFKNKHQSPLKMNAHSSVYQLSLENTIHFDTFSSREYFLKYVANYNIQIENEAEFQVTKRIIGSNGLILKKIIYDSCIAFNDHSTKVRLRGKGSGYKEGIDNKESEEPLQLCVSSLNYSTYSNCCKLLEILLERLYFDYYSFLKRKISSIRISGSCNNISKLKIMKYEFVVNRFPNNQ